MYEVCSMLKSVLILFISWIFFVVMDLVWIGYLARDQYVEKLSPLLRYSDGRYNVVWWAALLVWFFIVLGSYVFVLPIIKDKSFMHALWYGALFGLVLYAVYDLTNYSLLKGWPLSVTMLDIAWGAFVNAMLAVCMWLLYKNI